MLFPGAKQAAQACLRVMSLSTAAWDSILISVCIKSLDSSGRDLASSDETQPHNLLWGILVLHQFIRLHPYQIMFVENELVQALVCNLAFDAHTPKTCSYLAVQKLLKAVHVAEAIANNHLSMLSLLKMTW